jgi:arylsulfatase
VKRPVLYFPNILGDSIFAMVKRRELLKTGAYAALAAAFLCGCNPFASPRQVERNLILVVIDTLRADHVSAYGYFRKTTPFLDGFARENILFKRAIAPAPWTSPSLASIFTSTYPSAHGVVDYVKRREKRIASAVLSHEFVTLAETLKAHGFNTAGVTANLWAADYLGFAQGFDSFETVNDQTSEKVNNKAYKKLKSKEFTGKPFFLYLHYMDPHSPYETPGQNNIFSGSIQGRDYPPEILDAINRYDHAIHYLDAKLREFFNFLKENDLYDETLVVITADHGEKFGEHGGQRGDHGRNLHTEDIHVPLLVKYGGRNEQIDETTSLIDIFPSVMDILNVPFDRSSIQGSSFARGRRARAPEYVLSEGTKKPGRKVVVRRDGKKLILEFTAARRTEIVTKDKEQRAAVFDLDRDPRESAPLENEALLKDLRSGFYGLYGRTLGFRRAAEPEYVSLKEETIEQLKLLGYLND